VRRAACDAVCAPSQLEATVDRNGFRCVKTQVDIASNRAPSENDAMASAGTTAKLCGRL